MGRDWLREYRSALASRDLRLLLAALLISDTGTWAYNVGLLAYVFDRTHSLAWVGVTGLVRMLASLVFGPYGGVVADRMERIGLVARASLICAVLMGGLTVLAAAHGSPALALVLSGLTAAVSVVFNPSTAAALPSLVDEDELAAANAISSTIDQLTTITGPAVGALLLVVGSASLVFAANGVSFVLGALIAVRIRTRSRPVDVTEGGSAGPLAQMAVGWRAIVSLPAARTLCAFSVLVSFVYGTDTVLFVGVSAHRLGTGAQGFGYLLGALGLGGVLAAAAVNRLAGARRLALVILAGAIGYSLPTALLIVIHSPVLAFALEVFRGAATLVVDVLAITALQRAVDSDQLARVFGIFFTFVTAAIALGAVITPPVVSAFGLNGGLWTMSVGPTVLAVLGYPALLAIDRQTGARAAELEPRVAVLEGLGMFAAASRPILERLAAAASEVGFGSGHVVIREGDAADALYVLLEGGVDVSAHGEGGGPERPIRVMTAPAYFGEIGVLERIPRTATVTARGPIRTLRIDAEELFEALAASPPSTSLMENARGRLALTHPRTARSLGSEATIAG
jgi:predicted MFS family arabinose efflux permease